MQQPAYTSVIVHRKGQPHTVLIDVADYERFRDYAWSATERGYVRVTVPGLGRRGAGKKGAGYQVLLHRLILGLEKGDGLVADHINGDRTDNRRSNLRALTQAQNRQNTAAFGKSAYRGVGWDKSRQKWVAYCKLPGRRTKHLGRYDDELEAARIAAEYRAAHMPYSVAR